MFIRTFLWPAHPTAPMSFSIFHTLFNKYIKYIKNYVIWSVHTRCIYTQILLFLWLFFPFFLSIFRFFPFEFVYWIVFFLSSFSFFLSFFSNIFSCFFLFSPVCYFICSLQLCVAIFSPRCSSFSALPLSFFFVSALFLLLFLL